MEEYSKNLIPLLLQTIIPGSSNHSMSLFSLNHIPRFEIRMIKAHTYGKIRQPFPECR